MMSILKLTDLTKTFGATTAVNHVTLTIPTGKFVALLGPNGAGKSTILAMITGLLPPSSGHITLDGLSPQDVAYREQFGVVFQRSVLDADLTVQQNLRLRAGLYHHINIAWQHQLFQRFELTALQHQKYGTLSGGQRRRVDIVRALLHQPHILLLDEPSTGLDLQTRTAIWDAFEALQRTEDLTIILTTHYLEETERADWVYIVDQGRIIASDTVSKLQQTYARYQLILHSPNLPQLAQDLTTAGITAIKLTNALQVSVANAQASIAILERFKFQISDFDGHPGDMNAVFLALTGKVVR